MFMKKLTAAGMAVALVLSTPVVSLADSAAQTKADWEWQRDQIKQQEAEKESKWRAERERNAAESRGSEQKGGSSCGVLCKLAIVIIGATIAATVTGSSSPSNSPQK
jgi:hypothetical protein